MKKFLLLISITLSTYFTAQVGINNTDPKATLDVTARLTDGTTAEGLIAPRLTGNQVQLADTQYTTAQKGTLIYVTAAATAPSAKTINITTEGYYYFDGSVWQKIGGGATAGDDTNDAWINDTPNSMVKLGTNADGTARVAGADFVAKDNGAVGIGTSSPDASALLEINTTNKGVLLPRVALTSTTDQVTISSPATGLIVYNTGASTLTYKGYVFWNGTEWRAIDNSAVVNPSITGLNCNASSITPSSFTSGTPYNGVLSIFYTGGNGAAYPSGTPFVQNGLTFTLNSGTLNNGAGFITYNVTGTPNFTSPTTISVPINFLGFSCTATVGQNASPFAVGEIRTSRIVVPVSFNVNGGTRNIMFGKLITNTTTTDRRTAFELAGTQTGNFIYINNLRMDFMESGINNGSVSPKLFNTSTNAITYSVSSLSTADSYISGANTVIASGYYSFNIDGNDDFSCGANNEGEYVNAMLTFPNGEWYNCTWHATRDNSFYYFYMTAQRLN